MNIKNIIKDLSYTGYTKEIIRHEAIRIIEEQDKEIERLNNIIDELEEWAKENNVNNRDIYGYETEDKILYLEDFLDKLKELKGSDIDENNRFIK